MTQIELFFKKPKATLVGNVVKKTRQLMIEYELLLRDDEKVLSHNKVTGVSLNVPIYPTCAPTPVCSKTCYYAKGGSSWDNSLKKQLRTYRSIKADPKGMAARVKAELLGMRDMPTYLRWNGGGDLFYESCVMLIEFCTIMPDMPIWCTTRKPEMLMHLHPYQNLFVHFSLDASSMDRKADALQMINPMTHFLFSYQADKHEVVPDANLEGVKILFYDRYIPPEKLTDRARGILCPLNTHDDITGVCATCRRCFTP